jgi:hypothetical protein
MHSSITRRSKKKTGENKGVEIIQKKVMLGNCVKMYNLQFMNIIVLLQEVFENNFKNFQVKLISIFTISH